MRIYTGIGARATPKDVLEYMTSVARQFDEAGYMLYSGGCDGADKAFEAGSTRKKIFLPFNHFKGLRVDDHSYHTWTHEGRCIAKAVVPHWKRMTDSSKAFHSRNVHQVMGADIKTQTQFVVCYTDDGRASGGTATAINLAHKLNIPVYNLGDPWQDALFKCDLPKLLGD